MLHVQAFTPEQYAVGPVVVIGAEGAERILAVIALEVAGLFKAPAILDVILQVITSEFARPVVV